MQDFHVFILNGVDDHIFSDRKAAQAGAKFVGCAKAPFAPCPPAALLVGTRSLSSGRPMAGPVGFAHPHMGAFESSIPTGGLVFYFRRPPQAAARGAMRSVACRRGRGAQGLASGDLCSCSLHHLISGRTTMARYPLSACLRRGSHTRMRPIYETACLLAQGWHGHHPSRADHGRCRDADALVKSFTPPPA